MMQALKDMLALAEGKRTYLVCGLVCVLVFGVWQRWWNVPTEVYAGLCAMAMAALRAGVKREVGDLMDSASLPTPPITPDPAKPPGDVKHE